MTAPASPMCPACGAEVTGRYCSNCGQRASSSVRSFGAFLHDLVDDLFSVNATLPRTLRALLFRPGFLTSEYLRHRISPYIPPFRLYLVASVLFFLVVGLRTPAVEFTAADRAAMDSMRAALRDSAAARAARGAAPPRRFGISIDPGQEKWAETATVNLGSERLNHAVRTRLLALGDLPPDAAIQRLIRGFIESTPRVMFLLLPIYALLLKLLYVRTGRYYAEHFIFALHAHAFAFGVFLLMVLTEKLPVAVGMLAIWLMVYYWLALARVYQQGWLMTTWKWLVLGLLYLLTVCLGLALAAVTAILTV